MTTQPLATNTTPNKVVDYVVDMLRRYMKLSDQECYKSVNAAYIEGQNETVLQVVPGGASTQGGGDGYQDGGSLARTLSITVTIWRRMKLDVHHQSQAVLEQEGTGMLDLCETIRAVFSMTNLAGLVDEPIRYVSETATSWYDIESGVVRRDIALSATWAVDLPTTATE